MRPLSVLRVFRGRRRAAGGFTLIEMIIVIVVLGVSMTAIISLQGQVVRGQTDNADYQTGVQLLQECAEQVLALRRASGYPAVNANSCSSLGAFSGYTPSITISTPASPICAAGTTCDLLAITVTKSGSTLGPVNLLLVNY